jgi:hypothetical protein
MQPTLKEQIIKEEHQLRERVQIMNKHCKNLSIREKLSLINSKRSQTHQSSCFVSTFDSSLLNLSENEQEEFILQNIVFEEKFIKCLIIGDKQVGKTLFRNKMIDFNENDPKPTTMLDIKKKHFVSNNITVKVEIWDTNIAIQNSPLISSKLFY